MHQLLILVQMNSLHQHVLALLQALHLQILQRSDPETRVTRRAGIVLAKGNVNLLAAGFSDVEPVDIKSA